MSSEIKYDFQFRLWMFTVLTIEADKFAWSIKGDPHVRQQFKFRFNAVLEANKAFINYIKEHNLIDMLEDQGEWFSKALDIIRAEKDVAKKQELAILLKEWSEGKVAQCEDYLSKEDVIEFVSKFTILPKEQIKKQYESFKANAIPT